MTTTAGCTGQNRSDRRCRRRDHQALHAAVADLKAACTPPQPPPEGPSAAKKKVNLSSFLFEGDSFSSEDGHGGRDAIVKKAAKLTSAQKEQLKDGYITVRKTKLTSAQKEVVKQKVQSIHSEIPIFVAVMSKTNVDSGFFLTFSRYYANKYLGEEPQMSLQLLGKKWGVRFLDHRCDRRLGSGWRQFAEENNLKMGDICLFELLSNQKRTMEVYIIPANDYNYRQVSRMMWTRKRSKVVQRRCRERPLLITRMERVILTRCCFTSLINTEAMR
nr:B3 domain-containing protein Os03g0620400-like [Aegilops tauschii subsp. strangulata]